MGHILSCPPRRLFWLGDTRQPKLWKSNLKQHFQFQVEVLQVDKLEQLKCLNDWITTMWRRTRIVSEYSLKCDTSNNDESTLLCTLTHSHTVRGGEKEVPSSENSCIDLMWMVVCMCVFEHTRIYQSTKALNRTMCVLKLESYSRQKKSKSNSEIDFSPTGRNIGRISLNVICDWTSLLNEII